MNLPTDVAFDLDGNPLLADFNNQRIRLLEPDGTLTTIAGTGMHAYATIGSDALQTAFENPIDVVVRDDGTILVAELHAARVVQIDEDGRIRAYAGSGVPGYGGDGGPANVADLSEFHGIALGDDGTLYIADTENHCVRSVSPEPAYLPDFGFESRIIGTVAGAGIPGHADGDAPNAQFKFPQHLTWHDRALYIADSGSHTVRRLDLVTAQVETVAGVGGLPGYQGDGGPARKALLNAPGGVAVDEDGTIFIADTGNHLIRAVAPNGTISTVAGSYVLGADGQPEGAFDGDDGPATSARLHAPQNVTIGPDGHVWIPDMGNNAVRVLYR